MAEINPRILVILAGGKSQRMGVDKATMLLGGSRLIDLLITKYRGTVDRIILSAASDLGTGLSYIADEADGPDGPVGAIFSIARQLPLISASYRGFATIPVDAPFTPIALVDQLAAASQATISSDGQRWHPTFAHWRCDEINDIARRSDVSGQSASLKWLAEMAQAQILEWPDRDSFTNINQPEDANAAAARLAQSAENAGG